MDRQTEYEIRNYISDLNDKAIENEFSKLLKQDFKTFSKFELDSFRPNSMHQNAANLKTVLEWFQKKLLEIKINKHKFVFDQERYNVFKKDINKILMVCVNYLLNEKFKQNRGINKISIEINEKGEYYFKEPMINDSIDCQDTYFYEEDVDKSQFDLEIETKNEATKKIFEKYFSGKCDITVNEFFSLDKIDIDIYDSCKKSVKIDVDKIGCEFCSNVFNSKDQLVSILGAFMYLCQLYKIKNDMRSIKTPMLFEKPIIFKKEKLIETIKKFISIEENKVSCIIDYLTIDSKCQWGTNEYPLINVDNFILWIPSSFIMNDFQFSIVNGHYEKKIDIINRDDTVSQSVVDRISLECSKYKNIVVANNKEYFDQKHLFNGKELKSDVDVALYDVISNTVMIIECKWKEKLYVKGEKYDKICDDVNKIFKNQLDKHKYFLNLDVNNLDFIFDNNKKVKNRPYYPSTIQYIMVDKRIQLHYNGKHTLSEFNFLKIIKDNSVNHILKLDNVISCINLLETKVDYSIEKNISIVEYENKKINNSLFTLI
ncbi:hypothetical protein B5S50_11035 [Clostridium sp. 001]|nr:hypothetical protein B5S50_11035 [Clostridium sp. 001]